MVQCYFGVFAKLRLPIPFLAEKKRGLKIITAKNAPRSLQYFLSIVICLAACYPKLPPTLVSPSPLFPTSPSPLLPTSPSPTPSTSPSPQLPTSTPPIISLNNAIKLKELAKITFPSWSLVQAILWSPDGETLAVVAGEDVHFYQAGTLKERGVIHVGVWSPSLAFSPDGRLLAAGSRDGKLRVWEIAARKLLPGYPVEAHRKGVNQVAFSPDGSLIASGGNDGMARLWDVETYKRVSQMIGGSYAIPAVAFTPDGVGLAIVNAEVIRFRDVKTGRFIRTLRSDRSIYAITFNPDGQILASSHNDNTISLWDVEKERVLITLDGHAGVVDTPSALIWQVAFSPDGDLLASAGGDATLRLWNVATGDLLATLHGHTKAVTSVAFNPDGRSLASGGLDGTVILWEISQ